ncbi:MAG: dihydrolipoamide acyltransferase [Rhodocyclaceae bacterium]|nr:dihydrolipoamide acyltransferase [Rhodocyclaceae bacterium]
MSRVEVRVPKYPECWESCGNCAQGAVTVDSVLVAPGQEVARDDTLIVLETGKVALDIPSPVGGVVLEVAVSQYDPIVEGDLIAVIET